MTKLEKLITGFSNIRFKSSIDAIFLKNAQINMDSDVMKNPYTKSDLIFTCVSTTAKAISQVPLNVMKKTSKGTWEYAGDGDKVQRVINKPNRLMDSTEEFIQSVVSFLLLDGHVFIVPFPLGKGFASLWVVKKSSMEKKVNDGTGQLDHWSYTAVGDKVSLFLPEEVGSIKFFNPDDPIMGLSPLEAGSLPIMNDYKAAKYTSKFWDQGAVPGGVLETDKNLTEDRIKRIREQFKSEHQGWEQAHRIAVLEGGLKYQQVGLSQKDMEFIELRKYNRDSILQIFGMKKAVISVTEDLNYATAKEERKEWWQDTNLPLMKIIEASLTNIIYGNDITQKIMFDISTVESLHEDYTKRVETGEKLSKMGFTGNEINEKLELGFHPKPWRDKWYMPLNQIAVSESGYETLPVGPGAGTGTPLLPAAQLEEETEFKAIEYIEKDFDDKSQEKIFESNWKSLTGKTEIIELEFASKVRRVFFDMRKKSLKLLNKKSITDLENEEFLSDKMNLVKLTIPVYEDAVKTGGKSLAAEIEGAIGWTVNDPEILNHLTTRPLKLVGIIDTIKRQIRSEIAEGMKTNETIQQIAGRIRSTFNLAGNRSMTIARTEVAASANFGRSETLNRSGFKKKVWFTAMDEAVRPSHQAMHGQSVDVGKPWIVGGFTLRYPGDPAGPGHLSINCRCIEIADTKEKVSEEIEGDILPASGDRPSGIGGTFGASTWANVSKIDQLNKNLLKSFGIRIYSTELSEQELIIYGNNIGHQFSDLKNRFSKLIDKNKGFTLELRKGKFVTIPGEVKPTSTFGYYIPDDNLMVLGTFGKHKIPNFKTKGWNVGQDSWSANLNHEYSHQLYKYRLTKEDRFSIGGLFRKLGEKEISKISKYAATNLEEFFSEIMTVRLSPSYKDGVLSKEITQLIDGIIRRIK